MRKIRLMLFMALMAVMSILSMGEQVINVKVNMTVLWAGNLPKEVYMFTYYKGAEIKKGEYEMVQPTDLYAVTETGGMKLMGGYDDDKRYKTGNPQDLAGAVKLTDLDLDGIYEGKMIYKGSNDRTYYGKLYVSGSDDNAQLKNNNIYELKTGGDSASRVIGNYDILRTISVTPSGEKTLDWAWEDKWPREFYYSSITLYKGLTAELVGKTYYSNANGDLERDITNYLKWNTLSVADSEIIGIEKIIDEAGNPVNIKITGKKSGTVKLKIYNGGLSREVSITVKDYPTATPYQTLIINSLNGTGITDNDKIGTKWDLGINGIKQGTFFPTTYESILNSKYEFLSTVTDSYKLVSEGIDGYKWWTTPFITGGAMVSLVKWSAPMKEADKLTFCQNELSKTVTIPTTITKIVKADGVLTKFSWESPYESNYDNQNVIVRISKVSSSGVEYNPYNFKNPLNRAYGLDSAAVMTEFNKNDNGYIDFDFDENPALRSTSDGRMVRMTNSINGRMITISEFPVGQYKIQIYTIRGSSDYSVITFENEDVFEVTKEDYEKISTDNSDSYFINGINPVNFKNVEVTLTTRTKNKIDLKKENISYRGVANTVGERKEKIDSDNKKVFEALGLTPSSITVEEDTDFQQQKQPIDVVLCLDMTKSMEANINGMKEAWPEFEKYLSNKGYDVKYKLVAFGGSDGGTVDSNWQTTLDVNRFKSDKYDNSYEASDSAILRATQALASTGRKYGIDKTTGKYSCDVADGTPSKKYIIFMTDSNTNPKPGGEYVPDNLEKKIREKDITLIGLGGVKINVDWARMFKDEMENDAKDPVNIGNGPEMNYFHLKMLLGGGFKWYQIVSEKSEILARLQDSIGSIKYVARWKIKYNSPYPQEDRTRRSIEFDIKSSSGDLNYIGESSDRIYTAPYVQIETLISKPAEKVDDIIYSNKRYRNFIADAISGSDVVIETKMRGILKFDELSATRYKQLDKAKFKISKSDGTVMGAGEYSSDLGSGYREVIPGKTTYFDSNLNDLRMGSDGYYIRKFYYTKSQLITGTAINYKMSLTATYKYETNKTTDSDITSNAEAYVAVPAETVSVEINTPTNNGKFDTDGAGNVKIEFTAEAAKNYAEKISSNVVVAMKKSRMSIYGISKAGVISDALKVYSDDKNYLEYIYKDSDKSNNKYNKTFYVNQTKLYETGYTTFNVKIEAWDINDIKGEDTHTAIKLDANCPKITEIVMYNKTTNKRWAELKDGRGNAVFSETDAKNFSTLTYIPYELNDTYSTSDTLKTLSFINRVSGQDGRFAKTDDEIEIRVTMYDENFPAEGTPDIVYDFGQDIFGTIAMTVESRKDVKVGGVDGKVITVLFETKVKSNKDGEIGIMKFTAKDTIGNSTEKKLGDIQIVVVDNKKASKKPEWNSTQAISDLTETVSIGNGLTPTEDKAVITKNNYQLNCEDKGGENVTDENGIRAFKVFYNYDDTKSDWADGDNITIDTRGRDTTEGNHDKDSKDSAGVRYFYIKAGDGINLKDESIQPASGRGWRYVNSNHGDDGKYIYKITSVDKAGNEENITTGCTEKTLYIDTIPPRITGLKLQKVKDYRYDTKSYREDILYLIDNKVKENDLAKIVYTVNDFTLAEEGVNYRSSDKPEYSCLLSNGTNQEEVKMTIGSKSAGLSIAEDSSKKSRKGKNKDISIGDNKKDTIEVKNTIAYSKYNIGVYAKDLAGNETTMTKEIEIKNTKPNIKVRAYAYESKATTFDYIISASIVEHNKIVPTGVINSNITRGGSNRNDFYIEIEKGDATRFTTKINGIEPMDKKYILKELSQTLYLKSILSDITFGDGEVKIEVEGMDDFGNVDNKTAWIIKDSMIGRTGVTNGKILPTGTAILNGSKYDFKVDLGNIPELAGLNTIKMLSIGNITLEASVKNSYATVISQAPSTSYVKLEGTAQRFKTISVDKSMLTGLEGNKVLARFNISDNVGNVEVYTAYFLIPRGGVLLKSQQVNSEKEIRTNVRVVGENQFNLEKTEETGKNAKSK